MKIQDKSHNWNQQPIEVQYGKTLINIDLSKPCPPDLLERNYSGQEYIPAEVVRAVIRQLNYDVEESISANTFLDWVIVSAKVRITDENNRVVEWVAQDFLLGAKSTKTMFPQTARIVALAIKNALKYKYRFFEWEFTYEDEKNADYSTAESESVIADTYGKLSNLISNAKTEEDLQNFLVEQRKVKAGVLNDDLLTKLRADYKTKLESLSKK